MIERLRTPLAIALALFTACPALADDVAQAKAHFAIAARAYEANQFGVAIEAFEEAYRLAPRPAILFSIAQAHRRRYFAERQNDDLLRAVDYYRRYLKDDPQGSRVGEALTALGDLEPLAARLGGEPAAPAVEQPAAAKGSSARLLIAPSVKGAVARVDGGAAIALPNRVEVAPGRHSVEIEATGYQPERREVEVGAGESFAIDVRLLQKPAFVQPPADAGVRVYVDGRFAATTPLAGPLEVPAGLHAISLARRGHDPVSFELELGPGESKPVDADFSPTTQRVTSYALFAVSGALLVGGGVFTGLALEEENTASDIEDRATSGNISFAERDEHEEAIERRDSYRNVAIGAFAGALATGTTAALLYVLDQPEPEVVPARAPSPREPAEKPDLELGFAPLIAPDLAGLGVWGTL